MKKLSLLILLVAFSACQPKKDQIKAVSVNGVNGVTGLATSAACAQSSAGATQGNIFESAQIPIVANEVQGTFETRVKALLSATILPTVDNIGSISGQLGASTGVRFIGKMKLDQNGAVAANQSKMTVQVFDGIWAMEYIYNNQAKPIEIEFDPAKGHTISGQFNGQTGQGTLTVKDNYGEISFVGVIDAQNFSGQVRFQNTTSTTGEVYKGVIGNFTISRCAILL